MSVPSPKPITLILPETITMATLAESQGMVDGALSDGNTIVLNLGRTRFVDSSGLSVIVTALKRCRAAGGDVVLVNPQPAVIGLLELTRLVEVFAIAPDEAGAMAHLAAQQARQ